jgi:hypothetical protein
MSKRSDFERIERDFYKTPIDAVHPLIPFLNPAFEFFEPCAGDGRLTDHLVALGGKCTGERDIHPMPTKDGRTSMIQADALDLRRDMVPSGSTIITNPPWGRRKKDAYILHRLIEVFANIAETWLLFDADWMHTVQAEHFLKKYCIRIISIGRVKWFEDSGMTGKDNCCWYQFHSVARLFTPYPEFYGRGITPTIYPTPMYSLDNPEFT